MAVQGERWYVLIRGPESWTDKYGNRIMLSGHGLPHGTRGYTCLEDALRLCRHMNSAHNTTGERVSDGRYFPVQENELHDYGNVIPHGSYPLPPRAQERAVAN
jgi:hypothetical protein